MKEERLQIRQFRSSSDAAFTESLQMRHVQFLFIFLWPGLFFGNAARIRYVADVPQKKAKLLNFESSWIITLIRKGDFYHTAAMPSNDLALYSQIFFTYS